MGGIYEDRGGGGDCTAERNQLQKVRCMGWMLPIKKVDKSLACEKLFLFT